MEAFIGREKELAALKRLLSKRSASLVVVKGRRRIGKTRMLQEFARSFERAYFFSGLAPRVSQVMSPQAQRDEFITQFEQQFEKMPEDRTQDWSHVFWVLAQQVQQGRVLVVLDEISWMGSNDPDFLGKLKNAWDMFLKKNDKLILVLCGSVSTWIEKNILNSTGFFGRHSMALNLEEMPLQDCVKFWPAQDNRMSAYEKLKILSVTGGVPRYLESVDPAATAEQNIQRLCFEQTGILFDEFDKIFSDLFDSQQERYRQIVTCLAEGAKDQAGILSHLDKEKNGDISVSLANLISSGFISRDYTWKIQGAEVSKLSHYRLQDNYLRFYLKYILPNKERIRQGGMACSSLSNLAGWHSIVGLQVENLVLNNRREIRQLLQIDPSEIMMDNPFFQRKSTRQAGCQIDYMIQTKHNVLYICEIKFSSKEIGTSILDEMREKISRIAMPKQFSFRPVLIHVNGVSDAVLDSQYFSNIIDLSELVE